MGGYIMTPEVTTTGKVEPVRTDRSLSPPFIGSDGESSWSSDVEDPKPDGTKGLRPVGQGTFGQGTFGDGVDPTKSGRRSSITKVYQNNLSKIYLNNKKCSRVEEEEEEEEEKDVCNICLELLSSFPRHVTTDCNHTFCKECLQNIFKYKPSQYFIHCPTCRQKVSHKILYTPLSEIPANPDLSWMTCEMNKDMIESAYNIITQQEKWRLMQEFETSPDEGFMMCKNMDILKIMNEINETYRGGHSGASIAYTMRSMQKIARMGLDKFKEDYLQNEL